MQRVWFRRRRRSGWHFEGSGFAHTRHRLKHETFKPFWKLMRAMIGVSRIPQIVVLENVIGALTSHDGRDFATTIGALALEGYP